MILGGISIQGSYHSKNQDSFCAKKVGDACLLTVSDGLGSKGYSEIGSKALCDSAYEIVKESENALKDWTAEMFVERVHGRWIEKLAGYEVADCYTTMLILLLLPKRLLAVRLGDGFISFWTDHEIKVLFDTKEDYYANETDCLTEEIFLEKIECMELSYSTFRGAIMCSDGVGIGDMTLSEIAHFTEEFIEEYHKHSETDVIGEINGWLMDWTGGDDKTLVFALEG